MTIQSWFARSDPRGTVITLYNHERQYVTAYLSVEETEKFIKDLVSVNESSVRRFVERGVSP